MTWTRPLNRSRFLFAVASTALLALLLVSGCASKKSMAPIALDPGIAASLRLVETRTQQLFYDLGGNPIPPFVQLEAQHYIPLLDELRRARHLANVHTRPQAEQQRLVELEATYEALRTDNREFRLSFERLQEYRARLAVQMNAVLAMERR